MKTKIFLLSLGCPRNLVDSEVLTGLLKNKGFTFTEELDRSDVLIVNTCAFIESAKKESIDAILDMVSIKSEKKSDKPRLIVTGCLSQRYYKELKNKIPEIDAIFGSSDFIRIPDYIKNKSDKIYACISKTPKFLYNHKSYRSYITSSHYAYVKLQEGCRNFCSYCVIPKLRGPYRSRTMDSVIKEVKFLKEKNDVKEINLIGQDITLYGIDRYGKSSLGSLLKKLSPIMKDRWIRLLYTHPAHYSDELISVIRGEDSICKYLDIPIQHINDAILKRMNRNITKKDIIQLIQKLKREIPNLTLRTTIMVGFPGEGEKEFEELVDFIKDFKFERLGAFTFSHEEGTKAYKFKYQVPEHIKEERYKTILKIQEEISKEKNSKCLGKIYKVLIDEKLSSGHNQYLGRTEADAPEVDGACFVTTANTIRIGQFYNVRIKDTLEYDLVGEIV